MTRRILSLVVGVGLVVAGASTSLSAQASVLEGVWAVQEVSYAGPAAPETNQPVGLMLFAGNHYSLMWVRDSLRPDLAQDAVASASADRLRAVWGPLIANAGAFTVSGSTLTTRPIVAKMPFVMAAGYFQTNTFTLSGDTLVLTNNGPNLQTLRLTRVR